MSFDQLLDPIDMRGATRLGEDDLIVQDNALQLSLAPTQNVDFGYTDRTYSGGGGGAIATAPRPGSVFPERMSLNLMPLWDAVNEIPRGLEVFAAPLKFLGVGEVAKTIGESAPGQVLQNLILEPFRAIGRIAERAASGETRGADVFSAKDPWAQLVENAELNADTIKDIAEAISLVPAFKVLKGVKAVSGGVFPFMRGIGENLSGEGAKRILKGDIVGWVTAPVKNPVFGKEVAYNWGKVTGRLALGASLVGYAEEKIIEGIAPDSWAARELAGNRFVGDENSWRMPLDIAESLPLDLFGLIGKGKEALQFGRKASRVLGEEDSVLVDLFPRALINTIIDKLPGMKPVLEWIDNKSLRDAAGWEIMDRTNVAMFEAWRVMAAGLKLEKQPAFVPDQVWALMTSKGYKISENAVQLAHPNQLRYATQLEHDTAILAEQANMFNRYGRRGMREKQFNVIMGHASYGDIGYRPGWDKFKNVKDPAGRLYIAEDFHRWASKIQGTIDDSLGPYVETDLSKQIHASWGFLDNMTDDEFKAGGKEMFAVKYGAITARAEKAFETMKTRDQVMSFLQAQGITAETFLAHPMTEIGRAESQLYRVIQSIIKDGPDPAKLAERARYIGQIKKEKEPLLKGIHDKIDGLQAQQAIRRAELTSTALDDEAKAIVNTDLNKLAEDLRDARIEYFDTAMIGSRYTIGHPPKGIIQPIFDPSPSVAATARPDNYLRGRTRIGELIDSLFGAMPNRRLGKQMFDEVDNAFKKGGYDTDTTQAILTSLRKEVDKWRQKNIFGTSFNWAPFASVHNLPTFIINRTIQDTLSGLNKAVIVPAGYKDFAHIFYKAYPGPFKIFAREVLKKEINPMPYIPAFVNFTRSIYPLVRFSLSPRFILMNLMEAQFFQTFLGGKRSLGSISTERMTAIAASVLNARVSKESGRLVWSANEFGDDMLQAERDLKTLVQLANTWRTTDVVEALVRTLENAPAMKDFLKSEGVTSRAGLIKKLDEVWQERLRAISGEVADGTKEATLSKEIRDLRYRVTHPLSKAEQITARAELQTLEREYDDVLTKRRVSVAAENQQIEGKYAILLDVVVDAEKKSIEKARTILFSNPDRTVFERTFNSYLLYWPLSYQIKAGKALLEFMFSRGFGFKTNATVASATSEAGTWLEEQKKDPEVAAWFKAHRQAFFLAQQFFPAMPDETGVSLGPAVRLPLQTARGYKKPEEALGQGTSLGPIYDWNLMQEFMKQEVKPGGLLHPIFRGGTNERP